MTHSVVSLWCLSSQWTPALGPSQLCQGLAHGVHSLDTKGGLTDDQCRSQHLVVEGRKAWVMAQQWNERKSQMGEALGRKNWWCLVSGWKYIFKKLHIFLEETGLSVFYMSGVWNVGIFRCSWKCWRGVPEEEWRLWPCELGGGGSLEEGVVSGRGLGEWRAAPRAASWEPMERGKKGSQWKTREEPWEENQEPGRAKKRRSGFPAGDVKGCSGGSRRNTFTVSLKRLCKLNPAMNAPALSFFITLYIFAG